jgi:hypothetical protein
VPGFSSVHLCQLLQCQRMFHCGGKCSAVAQDILLCHTMFFVGEIFFNLSVGT